MAAKSPLKCNSPALEIFQVISGIIFHVTDERAKTITNPMLSALEGKQVDMSLVYGFECDGRTSMTNKWQGVIGRLSNSRLVNVHCLAHRLALATSAEKVSYMKRFDKIPNFPFYCFKSSPIRNEKICSIQNVLDEPQHKLVEMRAVLAFILKQVRIVYHIWDSLVT